MILQKLKSALGPSLRRFLSKDYRDGYLATHVRTGIALQIRALREKGELSQDDFATLTGKKQSTISRLEDTDYGRVSIQTLLDIASATGVALLVRFVDYPQFLRVTSDMSDRALAPDNIYESEERAHVVQGKAIFAESEGNAWKTAGGKIGYLETLAPMLNSPDSVAIH